MKLNRRVTLVASLFSVLAVLLLVASSAFSAEPAKAKPQPQRYRLLVLPFTAEADSPDSPLNAVAPALKEAVDYKMSRAPLIEIVRMTQVEILADERAVNLNPIEVAGAFLLGRAQDVDFLVTGKVVLVKNAKGEIKKKKNQPVFGFDGKIINMKTGEVGDYIDGEGSIDEVSKIGDVIVAKVIKYGNLKFSGAKGAAIRKQMGGMPSSKNDAVMNFGWGEAKRTGKGNVVKSYPDAEAYFKKATETDPKFTDAFYGLGRAIFSQGRYEEALKVFETAIALEPNNDEVKFWIGECYRGMKKYEEARKNYEEAIAIYPKFVVAKVHIGLAYEEENKSQEAMQTYREATEMNKELVKPYINLGKLLYKEGKYEEAAKEINEAIKRRKEISHLHRLLGEIYEKLGKTDDAIKSYKEAINYNQNDGESYASLGNLLASQGKFSEAIQIMNQAIERSDKSSGPHYGLAAVYEQQGNYKAAIGEYEKGFAMDSQNVVVAEKMAVLAMKAKDKDTAKKYYAIAYGLEPTFGTIAYELCKLEGEGENYTLIEQSCKQAQVQKPDDKTLILFIGRALYYQGKEEEAMKILEEATKTLSDNHRPFVFLGEIYLKKGDKKKAIEYFLQSLERKVTKKVVDNVRMIGDEIQDFASSAKAYEMYAKDKAKDADLYIQAGELWEKANKKADTERCYAEAIKVDPQKFDIWLKLANIQAEFKKYDDAVKTLRELIGRDDKNYEARYTLGVIFSRQNKNKPSVDEYERAITLNPNRPEAYNGAAIIYTTDKDLEDKGKAIKYATKAVQLSQSKNDVYLATLAEAYYADGDEDKAIEYITKALALKPGDKTYERLLKKYKD